MWACIYAYEYVCMDMYTERIATVQECPGFKTLFPIFTHWWALSRPAQLARLLRHYDARVFVFMWVCRCVCVYACACVCVLHVRACMCVCVFAYMFVNNVWMFAVAFCIYSILTTPNISGAAVQHCIQARDLEALLQLFRPSTCAVWSVLSPHSSCTHNMHWSTLHRSASLSIQRGLMSIQVKHTDTTQKQYNDQFGDHSYWRTIPGISQAAEVLQKYTVFSQLFVQDCASNKLVQS